MWLLKDSRRHPCGGGIVLYLDCLNVNILVVIKCIIPKCVTIGENWINRSPCVVSYNDARIYSCLKIKNSI